MKRKCIVVAALAALAPASVALAQGSAAADFEERIRQFQALSNTTSPAYARSEPVVVQGPRPRVQLTFADYLARSDALSPAFRSAGDDAGSVPAMAQRGWPFSARGGGTRSGS